MKFKIQFSHKTAFGLLLSLSITACYLISDENNQTVRQGENGSLGLTIKASHDTISSNQLDDLRIYITLKNYYPFAVQSLKFINFLECDVSKDGKYFHTVDSPIKPVKALTPRLKEVFPADSSITVIVIVDIKAICEERGYKNNSGIYQVLGSFGNNLIADDKICPTWVGYAKSNEYQIVVK